MAGRDTAVYNTDAMRKVQSDNESAMKKQASTMQSTKAKYESDAAKLLAEAAKLETQAAAQERIAATAMMMETYIDSMGEKRSRSVPDTARRSAARQSASQMRQAAAAKKQQAAALKAAAAALGAQISALHNAITTTKRYVENIISIVQRTDLTYAQQMDAIRAETQAFIAKINGIYNSFNDNFPLESKSLSSGTKGSNIASGQNDNLFMYIGSNYNSPSIVQNVLNKLLNMNPESVAKNKTAFYNGLPDDLKKQINISNLIATDDGFVLCTKPLNEIFNGLGYNKVDDADVNKFYDDYYIYGITNNKSTTYSLLGMRELETKQVKNASGKTIADTNHSSIFVPFVALDINEFRENNLYNLSAQVSQVVYASANFKTVPINQELLDYFADTNSKGSYLIAEAYVDKIINTEMKNGTLSVIVGNNNSPNAEDKLINERIIQYLRDNNAVVFNEKDSTITIKDLNNLSQDAKRAILAIRSGNTSYNAFAAETQFHALITNEYKLFGQSEPTSIFDTAIPTNTTRSIAAMFLESSIVSTSGATQEDFRFEEKILFGTIRRSQNFNDDDSKIVSEQRDLHGDL